MCIYVWNNFYSSYSHVFNCCFQVLYFCPGFKTGVKHLYNIISKKRESSKDEREQKAEKVTNPSMFFVCKPCKPGCPECSANLTDFCS